MQMQVNQYPSKIVAVVGALLAGKSTCSTSDINPATEILLVTPAFRGKTLDTPT
jgi:hypothetical protein